MTASSCAHEPVPLEAPAPPQLDSAERLGAEAARQRDPGLGTGVTTMANKERTLPAPQPNPETKRFWDAAGEGKLLVKVCRACGQAHHYPRALCPFCFSDPTE